MKTKAKLWGAACLTALLGLAAGCGPPPINPGPNPARVVLAVNQSLSAEQVNQAMQTWRPFPGTWTRFDSFLGPFWEVAAEQRQPDGSWRPLPLAPGQPKNLDGYQLQVRRVFLAPPGPQELRFRLEANIQRSWQEMDSGRRFIRRVTKDGTYLEEIEPDWTTRFQNVPLLSRQISQEVELRHDQELVLEPFK